MAILQYANAYLRWQSYGGPEEGGWYYDEGAHLLTLPYIADEVPLDEQLNRSSLDWDYEIKFDEAARERARELVRKMCKLAGHNVEDERFVIMIEGHPGSDYPSQRPHYE